MRTDVAIALERLEETMRKDVADKFKELESSLSAERSKLADLESRFQRQARNLEKRERVKIEFNPINGMYQWEVWAPAYEIPYALHDEEPLVEGREATYQEALDKIIYHVGLHRLRLPTKPNGITKNY